MGYSGPLLPGEKDPSHSHMYLLYSVQMQLHPKHYLHAVALYLQLVSSLISVLFAVNFNNGKHIKKGNMQLWISTEMMHFIHDIELHHQNICNVV